jgi:hypothetical protein
MQAQQDLPAGFRESSTLPKTCGRNGAEESTTAKQ